MKQEPLLSNDSNYYDVCQDRRDIVALVIDMFSGEFSRLETRYLTLILIFPCFRIKCIFIGDRRNKTIFALKAILCISFLCFPAYLQYSNFYQEHYLSALFRIMIMCLRTYRYTVFLDLRYQTSKKVMLSICNVLQCCLQGQILSYYISLDDLLISLSFLIAIDLCYSQTL